MSAGNIITNNLITLRSGIKNSEKSTLLKFVNFERSNFLNLKYIKSVVGQVFGSGQILDLSSMILKIEGGEENKLISNEDDWKHYFENIINTNQEESYFKRLKIKFYNVIDGSSISQTKNSSEEIKNSIKSKQTENLNEKILECGFDALSNDKTLKEILYSIIKNKLKCQIPELINTDEELLDKKINKAFTNVYDNYKLTKLLINENEENPECEINPYHNDSDIQSFSIYYNDKNIKEFSSSLFLNK
jgi:hypothetical protein